MQFLLFFIFLPPDSLCIFFERGGQFHGSVIQRHVAIDTTYQVRVKTWRIRWALVVVLGVVWSRVVS